MKPLVSFCLKSYNGRRYLRESMEGAFAQTYRPLEIVVSDDASTDGSWETIQAEVAKRGAIEGVRVVLNRNPTNLGSLGNWERLCELASGELLIKADGDDISLPERTERIVDAWFADGKRATVICHSGWQIGIDGRSCGRLRQVLPEWPLGAAMAFSDRVFKFYGRSSDGSLVDDEVLVRRAQMLGPALVIADRLVKYRLGSGQTTDEWNIRSVVEKCTAMSLAAVRNVRQRDLPKARRVLGPDASARWEKRFRHQERRLEAKSRLVTSRKLAQRWTAFRDMGQVHWLSVSGFLRLSFLLPRPMGSPLLFAYVGIRNLWRRVPGICRIHSR